MVTTIYYCEAPGCRERASHRHCDLNFCEDCYDAHAAWCRARSVAGALVLLLTLLSSGALAQEPRQLPMDLRIEFPAAAPSPTLEQLGIAPRPYWTFRKARLWYVASVAVPLVITKIARNSGHDEGNPLTAGCGGQWWLCSLALRVLPAAIAEGLYRGGEEWQAERMYQIGALVNATDAGVSLGVLVSARW